MAMTISEEEVMYKCRALKEATFWLPEPVIRPIAWLQNFESPDDRDAAILILDRFHFFSNRMTLRMLQAAFDSLLQQYVRHPNPSTEADSLASQFIEQAVFTPVEGESPNRSDSGNLFCRNARQYLKIPQGKLVDPDKAVEHAATGGPVVFIDDFIGTGQQFKHTWRRPYLTGFVQSFADVARQIRFPCFYLCVVVTEYAQNNIDSLRLPVTIYAAHTLGDKYSITNDLSEQQLANLDRFLRKYAPSLDLDSHMRRGDNSLYGYHGLGLTIAFEHSVPDASLPIIWANGSPGWVPLIERK
jgi:hypothetical protein